MEKGGEPDTYPSCHTGGRASTRKVISKLEAEVTGFSGINLVESMVFNKEGEQSIRVNEIGGDIFS